MSLRLLVARALLAFAAIVPALASAQDTGHSQRFHVMLGGNHVGSAQWRWRADGEQPFFDDEQTLRIAQRGGGSTNSHRYRLWRETGSDTQGFQRHYTAGPAAQTEEGRIEQGRALLDRGLAGKAFIGEVPADTVMPYALVDRLRALALAPQQESHFVLFDLGDLTAAQAATSRCVQSHDALRCIRLASHGRNEDWLFSPDGRLQRIESEFVGLPMVLLACESDCDRASNGFDVIGHLIVASPYRIPQQASQKKLRFLLSREDGEPVSLVTTGDQVFETDGARAVVTICRGCGREPAPSAKDLERYRRPNLWVQSDHPEIRRLATRVGSQKNSVDSRMRRSVALMLKTLKPETGYIGYADAVQTLRLGRGDCVGHAVLLAALARAQGIPARIAVGMAYADRFSGRRDVFSPHAWVQAWDGTRWVSYDSALLDFDSTHVALAVDDGNTEHMAAAFLQLSRLKVERVGVVKAD